MLGWPNLDSARRRKIIRSLAVVEISADFREKGVPLQVAETFKQIFNEYDLSVIYHFKNLGEARENKGKFIAEIRRSYGGSPPGPTTRTIKKLMRLPARDFEELIDSIRVV